MFHFHCPRMAPGVAAAVTMLWLSALEPAAESLRTSQASEATVLAAAQEILQLREVNPGLIVHLGAGNGRLTASLAFHDTTVVHGLVTNDNDLQEARRHIQSAGLYGRVSVMRSSLQQLPYADNLVNLIVVENLPWLLAEGLPLEEVMRVLTPRGILCGGGVGALGEIVDQLKRVGFSEVRSAGNAATCLVARKPCSKEMDEWGYFEHGPDGNPVSQDRLIGPATRLRWRHEAWGRHAADAVSGHVTAAGRVFYCCRMRSEDGYSERYLLEARDAFNGLLLWQRPLKGHVGEKYGDWNVVATAERLFLPLEPTGPLVALDAKTGAEIRRFEVGHPGSVIHRDGILYMGVGGKVWAVSAETGEVLWNTKLGTESATLFLGNGRLFVTFLAYPERKLGEIEMTSGKLVWSVTLEGRPYWYNSPFYYEGMLVMIRSLGEGKLCIVGYSQDGGSKIWQYEPKGIFLKGGCLQAEVFGAQGLIWSHVDVEPTPEKNNAGPRPSAWIALDPKTGEIRKRHDDPTSDPQMAKMLANGIHRCNRGRATVNQYFFGTYDVFEWARGRYVSCNVARASCGIKSGMLPANGLLYVPPWTCACRNFMQRGGMLALTSTERQVPASTRFRLEKGPAAGTSGRFDLSADGWPCYRHDARRSGATSEALGNDLTLVWETQIGARLTAPVVARGLVIVADYSTHAVHAVEAQSGQLRWSFTADGPVDSPPTVGQELCWFGGRDGWVYAVRLSDGSLAWRCRIAPAEELIMVDGHLESAWPVHGSLVVAGDKVFAAAGWHTGLDGGITICALDAASGDFVWTRRLEKLAGDVDRANFPVSLLASDGQLLYMGRHVALDLSTGETREAATPADVMFFGASGFGDNEWVQHSNTKGTVSWSVGRVRGHLLVFAEGGRVYGVTFPDDFPLWGRHSYRLFAKQSGGRSIWEHSKGLRVRAMALAGSTLFVAGTPDLSAPEIEKVSLRDNRDFAAVAKLISQLPEEQRNPGREIWACAVSDGTKLAAWKIGAEPVFDGLAVAHRRLYLACEDGKIRCLAAR